jgi:hypothetical protein
MRRRRVEPRLSGVTSLGVLSSAGSCQRILLLDLQRAILKPRRRPSQACRPPRAVLIQARKKKGPRQARPKFREEKPEGLTGPKRTHPVAACTIVLQRHLSRNG